jgi:hypothetical protein
MSTAEYIPTKETAKLIRSELAQRFPGVTFSVRTEQYSGGSHVNVTWADGPTQAQVDRAVRHFSGRTFDGMDDSTHFHDTLHEGRLVHFGGSAPSCQRRVSQYDALHAQALEIIRARCRLDETGTRFGNDWIDNLASGMVHACDFREATPLERAFRLVVLREREI